MSLTTKLHFLNKKLQNVLLSVSPLVFHVPTTVSARRTTGICIVSRSLDPSIRLPYPVYTLKFIVITKITKKICRPQNQQQQHCAKNISSSIKQFYTAYLMHLYSLKLSRLVYSASIYGIYFKSYVNHKKKRKSRILSPSTTSTTVPAEYLKLHETVLHRISHASVAAKAL